MTDFYKVGEGHRAISVRCFFGTPTRDQGSNGKIGGSKGEIFTNVGITGDVSTIRVWGVIRKAGGRPVEPEIKIIVPDKSRHVVSINGSTKVVVIV